MIQVHALAHCRAVRILWLAEELGLEAEIVRDDRTADYKAPGALRRLHPLGKSPIFLWDRLALADIQLATAEFGGVLSAHPAAAYGDRLRRRPAFARAVARTGPVMPAP